MLAPPPLPTLHLFLFLIMGLNVNKTSLDFNLYRIFLG